jgi:hypothetical protein
MAQGGVRTVPAGALCIGAECRRRHESGQVRRRVLAGLQLCRACRDNLAAGLGKLPSLYDECGRLLAGSDQPRDRTSGGPMPGMPFNTAAADVRESILGVLASWAGMVVEERRVSAPARTVRALARFLRTHADWMAAHGTATEATQEVTQLVRSARQVAYPNPVRRVPIGTCVEAGCAGELFALVQPQESLLPPEISCAADPCHSWPAHQWMQLSRRVNAAPSTPGLSTAAPSTPVPSTPVPSTTSGPRWLSAAGISRLWSIAPGSVYRLASEQRWRRRNRARRTYYHEADVQQTFDQRERQPSGSARS